MAKRRIDEEDPQASALWDAIKHDEDYRAAVRMADPQYGVDSSIVNQIVTEVVRVVWDAGWRPPMDRASFDEAVLPENALRAARAYRAEPPT